MTVVLVLAALLVAGGLVQAVRSWRTAPAGGRALPLQLVVAATGLALVAAVLADAPTLVLVGLAVPVAGGIVLARVLARTGRPARLAPPHLRGTAAEARARARSPAVAAPDVGAAAAHPEAVGAVAAAVEEVRRTRGLVAHSSPATGQDVWWVVHGAHDGRVVAGVAPPAGRGRAAAGRRLRALGLTPDVDVWSVELGAGEPARRVGELVVAALVQGAGWDGSPLARAHAWPGIGPAGAPGPAAPPEEHVAAALVSGTLLEDVVVRISSGVPSTLWVYAFPSPDGGEMELHAADDHVTGEVDVWRAPRTEAAARDAAGRVVAGVRALHPGADREPLLVELMPIEH